MIAGEEVTLTTDPAYDGKSDAATIYVGYPPLASKVAACASSRILILILTLTLVLTRTAGPDPLITQ